MIRAFSLVAAVTLAVCLALAASSAPAQDALEDFKARCASFGFQDDTDAFANCVMQLSLKQDRHKPPDRDTLIRQYRDLSTARQGDSRYPVCGAAMMDNELDITIGKWVGPNCQLAPG